MSLSKVSRKKFRRRGTLRPGTRRAKPRFQSSVRELGDDAVAMTRSRCAMTRSRSALSTAYGDLGHTFNSLSSVAASNKASFAYRTYATFNTQKNNKTMGRGSLST